jgi:hypothetical protein
MTTNGLLSKPLMDAQVHYRHNPPAPLLPSLMDGLRWIGQTLAEVAEAMLRPERETQR